MKQLRVLAGLCFIALFSTTLFAQRMLEPDGSILLPAQKHAGSSFNPVQQQEFSRTPEWRAFMQRHGFWQVQWNEPAGTPHRAFGPAISLTDGRTVTATNVEQVAMSFIEENAELLKVNPSELRLVDATEVNNRWYVSYTQTRNGIDVLLSEVELRIFGNGNLMAFGSDFYQNLTVSSIPALTYEAAQQQALAGLAVFEASPGLSGDGTLYYLPIRDGAGVTHHLVYRVMVHLNAGPGNPMDGNYMTYVDAHSGEVVWRYNLVHSTNIRGRIFGEVHPVLPTEPYVNRPMAAARLTITGAGTTVTDSLGFFLRNLTLPSTLTTRLDGPFVNVDRSDASDASLSIPVNPGDSITIQWNNANSHPAERDAFHHTNLVLSFLKNIDPAFTAMNYAVPCVVNYPLTCNAQWRGSEGMRFYNAGGGCPNTGEMPSVIYHEYGHGVNQRLFEQRRGYGMINGGINEGTADILSAMVEDSPFIGRGFTGPGTILRNLNNTRRYPEHATGQVHNDGLIIGGAFWSLRMATNLETARRLAHFAKYGTPDDTDLGVALAEWFIETLVADDDDGNLANGTPNGVAIIQSFDRHGMGPSLFFSNSFTHTPLPSTSDTLNPYVAFFTLDGVPIPGGEPASVALRYSADNFVTTVEVPAARVGATTQYTASIPPQPNGVVVKYYLTALEPISNTRYTFPSGAPTAGVYRFHVGFRSAAPGVIYAASSGVPWGKLYTIEPATGVATEVGPLGINELHGLVVHPGTKELLGIVAGGSSASIYRLSPTYGDALPLTTLPVPSMRTIAFRGDTLYGATTTGRLYRLNFATGDSTFIGAASGIMYSSISVHPATGVLWASVRPPIGLRDRIYTVDTFTGSATLVGATGDNFITPSIAFSPAGVLYGLKGSGSQDNTLIMISQTTGAGTLIGLTGTRGLLAITMSPDSVVSSAGDLPGGSVPLSFSLRQNYPNPFNPATKITYTLPSASKVKLVVYDVLGREVATLVNEELNAGIHTVGFSGVSIPSGVYFYTLRAGAFTETRKMMILK